MKMNRVELGLGGGSVLQSANRTHTQMMSYLIKTPDNKTVMIDGGNNKEGDALYLYNLLRENGGVIDKWFITHAHNDHFGALLWMLENIADFDIDIKEIYLNFPPLEWIKTVENGSSYQPVKSFIEKLNRFNVIIPARAQIIECGGMSFEILNDIVNYKEYDTINDTSLCIIAHFPARDILFLADIEQNGGYDLIEVCGKEKLRCDIVQMAHHGQDAVKKDFYETVMPKICLYNAPDWLWDNTKDGVKGAGPFKTLETRAWMEELGTEDSYPCAYGDYLFT